MPRDPSAQQVLSLGSFGACDLYGLPFDGNIYGAWIWNRALLAREVASITANPWQLFKAPTRNIFTIPQTVFSRRISLAPVRITKQPQGVAQVDWGNPLNKGLSDVWMPGNNLTTVRNSPAIPAGTNSYPGTYVFGVGPTGQFVRGDGVSANTGIQIAGNSNNLLDNSNCTWFIVRRNRDTVVRSTFLHYGYDGGASNRAILNLSGTTAYFDYGNATAGSGRMSAPYTKDTLLETIVVVAGQIKGREMWQRGVKIGSDPNAKFVRSADSNVFGVGPVSSGTPFDDVETYLFGVVNREWSDAEIVSFCANPWQLFRAPTRALFTQAPLVASRRVVRSNMVTVAKQAQQAALPNPKYAPQFLITAQSGMPIDVVRNNIGVLAGGAKIAPGLAQSQDMVFSNPSNFDCAALPDNPAYDILGPLTLMWVGSISDTSTYNMLITRAAGSGGNSDPFEFRLNPGGAGQLLRAGSGTYTIANFATVIPINQQMVIFAQWDTISGVASFFINGVETPRATGISQVVLAATGQPLYLGRRGDGYYSTNKTSMVAGWSRILNAKEITDLSANPWQLFKPQAANLFTNSPLYPSKGVKVAGNLVRTSQPQFAAQVNYGSPLTKGLVLLASMGAEVEAVNQRLFQYGGASKSTTTSRARAVVGSTTTLASTVSLGYPDGVGQGINAVVPSTSNLSAHMRIYYNPAGATQAFIGDSEPGASYNNIYWGVVNGNWYVSLVDAGSTNRVAQGSSVPLTTGYHDLEIEHDVTTGISLWVDGILVGSIAFAGARSTAFGQYFRIAGLGIFNTSNAYGCLSAFLPSARLIVAAKISSWNITRAWSTGLSRDTTLK